MAVLVPIETPRIDSSAATTTYGQLCSGFGATPGEAAGWAQRHLKRILEEGITTLSELGAIEPVPK